MFGRLPAIALEYRFHLAIRLEPILGSTMEKGVSENTLRWWSLYQRRGGFRGALTLGYIENIMRRVGRVVDGTGLENRHTRKGIGGSNPSLSASHQDGALSIGH